MNILRIIALLIIISVKTTSASVDQGTLSFNNENYDKAFRSLYVHALEDNKNAQFLIGKIYLNGLGSAEQNVNKGLDFIKKSIDNGNMNAALFLSNSYEKGEIVGKDIAKALSYLQIAVDLGAGNKQKEILRLTTLVEGKTSKNSCLLYSKNDRSRVKDLISCMNKGYVEGDIIKYYKWDFEDNNNLNSIYNAVKLLIDEDSKYYNLDDVIEFIPLFVMNASDDDLKKWQKLFSDGRFKSEDCIGENDGFVQKPLTEPVKCILAAESGQQQAIQTVIPWWFNGDYGLPLEKAYAEVLRNQLDASSDPLIVCKTLREIPSDHFQCLKDVASSNEFFVEKIADELFLEVNQINNSKYETFPGGATDIKFVLNYVNYDVLEPSDFSKIYLKIFTDPAFIKNGFDKDPLINQKLSEAKFDPYRYQEINKNNSIIALQYIEKYMMADCNAVQYASSNLNLLKNINSSLYNQAVSDCGINDAADQFQTVLNSDQNSAIKLLQDQLSKNDYDEFCKNSEAFVETNTQTFYESLPEDLSKGMLQQCNNSLVIKSNFAINNYISGYPNLDLIFEDLEYTCEEKIASSCSYAAYIFMFEKIDANRSFRTGNNSSGKRSRAYTLALRGCDLGDNPSCAVAYDVLTHKQLVGTVLPSSEKEYIFNLLSERYSDAFLIRENAQCLKEFTFGLGKCRDECRVIKKIYDKGELYYISNNLAKEYLDHKKCN